MQSLPVNTPHRIAFQSVPTKANTLQPGDVYLWGSYPRGYETREVLGVLQHGAFESVLLEVRKPDGNVTRTSLYGAVSLLVRGAVV